MVACMVAMLGSGVMNLIPMALFISAVVIMSSNALSGGKSFIGIACRHHANSHGRFPNFLYCLQVPQ